MTRGQAHQSIGLITVHYSTCRWPRLFSVALTSNPVELAFSITKFFMGIVSLLNDLSPYRMTHEAGITLELVVP